MSYSKIDLPFENRIFKLSAAKINLIFPKKKKSLKKKNWNFLSKDLSNRSLEVNQPKNFLGHINFLLGKRLEIGMDS